MSSMFYDAVVTGSGDVTAAGVAVETAGVLTAMAVGVTAASGVEKGSETGGRGDDVNVAMSGSAVGAGRDMAAPDVIVTGGIVANDGTGTDEFNVDEMLISEAEHVQLFQCSIYLPAIKGARQYFLTCFISKESLKKLWNFKFLPGN